MALPKKPIVGGEEHGSVTKKRKELKKSRLECKSEEKEGEFTQRHDPGEKRTECGKRGGVIRSFGKRACGHVISGTPCAHEASWAKLAGPEDDQLGD
jgi:hypothetical protein